MGRRKARMTVGSKYVAIGALTEILEDLAGETVRGVAEGVIEAAYDVEHFPVAGKVQITLDLSRLDQQATIEPAVEL